MSRKTQKPSFEIAFERALRAAASNIRSEIGLGAVRLHTGQGESKRKRRFIGKAQIDIKHKGVRSVPGGAPVPWYLVTLSVGKIRHKFSLGAPATWHTQHATPMDDGLIDAVAQSAIRFALDTEDDSVPDVVTDVVEQATDGHILPDGSYPVRSTILTK